MLPAPPQTDRALSLVADLADALGQAHTEATLVARAMPALARHLPVLSLELLRTGVLAGDVTAPELVVLSQVTGTLEGAIEIQRAREAGAHALVLLPLRDGQGRRAVVLLALGGLPASPTLTAALLDALARSFANALRQVELLGRVATLSRKALGDTKQLRAALDQAVLPDEIVAASPAMRVLFLETLPLVARHDTTVLVLGETGTGKEVVARRIHALSRRAARPFLQVNCGALPDGLVESTLFGHERGAFTGAATRHLGVFERAHGGTLLLDEVGDLPKGAQVKLLRVLQEGELERLGGETRLRTDVRIVAATHRPLEEMVASGTFREDLFYRLQVFPLVVPPLRERPEDLGGLVRTITLRLAARFGRVAPSHLEAALARLRVHAFPGNVRELENLIERAMITSPGDVLELPDSWMPRVAAPEASLPEASPPIDASTKRLIEAALAASEGRVYGPLGAAARLGLKPTTLQSKMKKLGVRPRAR